MPYTLIEQYDCGSIGNPGFPDQTKIAAKKPLLSEVFEMAIGLSGTIKFNLELKSHPDYDNIFTPSPDIFVDAVLDIIDDNKVFERTNLQSFDLRILESVKIQNPKMPVALLIDKDENLQNKLEIMSFKPEILGPYFELLTQENVRHYQSLDYKIIPWTVNNLEDIDRMIKMGVDGIITDFPHRLITK